MKTDCHLRGDVQVIMCIDRALVGPKEMIVLCNCYTSGIIMVLDSMSIYMCNALCNHRKELGQKGRAAERRAT